jgi:peroxiredoxin
MTAVTARHGLLRKIRLHVDDTGGPGRPVVLSHAWPLSAESSAPQVAALYCAGYRVVTYDRRGFGRSDKPLTGYTYDTLTKDLHTVIETLDLNDVTVVGFSMGGGEVAHYFARYGAERLRSVVFASAVTPYMLHSSENPNGPMTTTAAVQAAVSFIKNADAFYDQQMTEFFSANGELTVTEAQRQEALIWCRQASKQASMACLLARGRTDFRGDLAQVSVPSLVIHGGADASVPVDGSARRTHRVVRGSELRVIAGGPHGCNISHADEFNRYLLDFLARV